MALRGVGVGHWAYVHPVWAAQFGSKEAYKVGNCSSDSLCIWRQFQGTPSLGGVHTSLNANSFYWMTPVILTQMSHNCLYFMIFELEDGKIIWFNPIQLGIRMGVGESSLLDLLYFAKPVQLGLYHQVFVCEDIKPILYFILCPGRRGMLRFHSSIAASEIQWISSQFQLCQQGCIQKHCQFLQELHIHQATEFQRLIETFESHMKWPLFPEWPSLSPWSP